MSQFHSNKIDYLGSLFFGIFASQNILAAWRKNVIFYKSITRSQSQVQHRRFLNCKNRLFSWNTFR